jgi:NAD(P)-dependent dehydrogenase (short-subunit alcohol dehydrogenase family)
VLVILLKASQQHQLYEKEDLDVIFYQLDVSNQKSIYSMVKEVHRCFGRLDILVNNAAILYDT